MPENPSLTFDENTNVNVKQTFIQKFARSLLVYLEVIRSEDDEHSSH